MYDLVYNTAEKTAGRELEIEDDGLIESISRELDAEYNMSEKVWVTSDKASPHWSNHAVGIWFNQTA